MWPFSKRSSPENPSTNLADPQSWFIDWIRGGSATKSGQSVTEETALALPAVYDAIRILGETVAQLPLNLYQREDRQRRVRTDHSLHDLVHHAPHPDQTSFVWREQMQSHAAGWGNGYAHIQRNGRQEPVGLELLLPWLTRIEKVNGRLVVITKRNGVDVRIDWSDVVHIPALGFDGICGKSPIRQAREALGLGLAAQEFGSTFFGNGAHLGTVIRHPKQLGKDGRTNLAAAWDKFKGAGYQGAVVLEEGIEVERLAIPPEDAQFIETRRFSVTDVARIFNIPPHMLADLEKSSFNNMAEQSIQFLRFTLTPWLVKWEAELNRKLLSPQQRRAGFYFKFVVQGLLRGTQKERAQFYHYGIGDGWLNRNEVRELEDMNPEDGLDDFLTPMNMQGADEGGENDETDEERAAFEPFIVRAAEVLSGFDSKWLTRKAAKHGNEPISAWINAYGEDARDIVERNIGPLAEAAEMPILIRDVWFALADERYRRARVDRVEDITLLSAEEVAEIIRGKLNAD